MSGKSTCVRVLVPSAPSFFQKSVAGLMADHTDLLTAVHPDAALASSSLYSSIREQLDVIYGWSFPCGGALHSNAGNCIHRARRICPVGIKLCFGLPGGILVSDERIGRRRGTLSNPKVGRCFLKLAHVFLSSIVAFD